MEPFNALNLWGDDPLNEMLSEGLNFSAPKAVAHKHEGESSPAAHSAPPNLDVLGQVLEYLDHRELYAMSNTCKHVRSSMITLPLVVKCGMTSRNGNVRKTLANVTEAMERRSIWVPSPLRLLRLMNGRGCEFCDAGASTHARKLYCVFACRECMRQGGRKRSMLDPGKLVHEWAWLRNVHGNYNDFDRRLETMGPVFKHPGVAHDHDPNRHTVKMWGFNVADASGERLGPLVTLAHFINMCNNYYKHKENGVLDRYMEEVIRAPGAREYDEYLTAARDARDQADRYDRERKLRKASAQAARNRKIVEKVEQMIAGIRALLPQSMRSSLAYVTNDTGESWKRACVVFTSEYVNDGAASILGRHLGSASKVSKKKLKELAAEFEAYLSSDEGLEVTADMNARKDLDQWPIR